MFNKLIGSNKFWYLIITFLLITALVVGFTFWSKFTYKNRYHFYSIKTKNMPPEIKGTAINLFGLKVGRVEGIGISKDYDSAELSISILEDVNKNLTKDASLTIIPKLFGSLEFELNPGKSPDPLGDDDTLRLFVEESADYMVRKSLKSVYEDIVPKVSSAVNNISRLGEELKNVDLDKIWVLMGSFEENMRQTYEFIQSLNALQTDLRDVMFKMSYTMDNMTSFTGKINSFAEKTFGDEKNLADAINKIVANTENLLQNGNDISLKTKVLLGAYEKTGENLNTMSLDIIQLTNSLPVLVKSINKMVEDFSIIGLAIQRHWLLKRSVKGVKKERLIKGKINSKSRNNPIR